MTVRDTSREAYEDIEGSLGPRQVQVLNVIRDQKLIDCKHIARILGVDRCQVTGRIDELKQQGLIYEAAKLIALDASRRSIHYSTTYWE